MKSTNVYRATTRFDRRHYIQEPSLGALPLSRVALPILPFTFAARAQGRAGRPIIFRVTRSAL